MKELMQIRRLTDEYINECVALVRNGLSDKILIPSIYRAFGIGEYIKNEICNPFSAYDYFMLCNEGQFLGFAEFKKISARTVILNMIATNQAVGIKGLGSMLLKSSMAHYWQLGFEKLLLDVSRLNEAAFRWYGKIGFIEEGHTSLYILPTNNTPTPFYILNYPQFKALHSVYGFSMLDILIDGQLIKVGVIDNSLVFRNTADTSILQNIAQLSNKLTINDCYFLGNEIAGTQMDKIDTISRLYLNLNEQHLYANDRIIHI